MTLRTFKLVRAIGVTTAMSLAASALTTLVTSNLLFDAEAKAARPPEEEASDDEDDGDEDEAPAAVQPLARPSRGAVATGGYNIFCPSCQPQTEAATPVVPGDTPLTGAVPSSLPLRLMATMEADDPRFSLATIFCADEVDGGGAGIYGIGESVAPGVTIEGVTAGRVDLRNGSRLEYLEVGAPVGASRPVSTPEASEPPSRPSAEAKPSGPMAEASDAISCANENTCTVERAFVEKILSNPAMLMGQARVRPSADGFVLGGIRGNSLPSMLGLQNGDVLTSVNGEAITSVDQAMALYSKLRRATNLQVTLMRGGSEVSKEIQIQ